MLVSCYGASAFCAPMSRWYSPERSDHGEFQIRTDRSDHIAEHANGTHLRQRVFHEVAGAHVEYVHTVDLVELLFEVVQAGYGTCSGEFVGSETAERNNIPDSRVSYCCHDRVTDAVLVSADVVAGRVGRNHDVGCVCFVEGFGQGGCVEDIADEYLRAFRRERLQMSRVSANDTNFLPAGKKVLRHYVSSVAACSKNYVHVDLHS
jgi:hypothetical protein